MISLEKVGYKNPEATATTVFNATQVAVVAALLAKIIIPQSNPKSHFVFAGTTSILSSLAWKNDHIKTWTEKGSKKIQDFKVHAFLVGTALTSIGFAKYLTGKLIHPISYINAVGRGAFLVGTYTTSAYMSESFRKHRERM